MVINRKTGRKLVRDGKAAVETSITADDGRRYAAITRYDIQRTDHYPLRDDEVE